MLTDTTCRQARCPTEKNRLRLTDSGGLYLEVAPSGSKRWFWKFYPNGKESRLALGSYPAVSLKAARDARDAAKRLHAEGTNPVHARKVDRLTSAAGQASTFEVVARDLHATKSPEWSATHARQWLRCMEKDLFPWLGSMPIASVTPQMLLTVLQKVEARGVHQLPHDLREFAGQTFRHGIATGRCERNPAADLVGALKRHTVRHAAAIFEPVDVGAMLRAFDAFKGSPYTRVALPLSALLFQRPGNIRAMEWAEIDTAQAMWTIPAEKMKRTKDGKANGRPHFVPLSRQALALLEEVRPLSGHGRYVFPSALTGERCMSENTVRAALRRLGYEADEMTAHGFRAMARTIMVERLDVAPDVIEAQLAHGKSGSLGMAYDRAKYMEQRRQMMQKWADYLDALRDGGDVIALLAA